MILENVLASLLYDLIINAREGDYILDLCISSKDNWHFLTIYSKNSY